jgi:hypothetical protein
MSHTTLEFTGIDEQVALEDFVIEIADIMNNANVQDIAYGNGRFLVTDRYNYKIYHSTTSFTTWVSSNIPRANPLITAFGNHRFVVFSPSDHIEYSSDGDTWLSTTCPVSQNWKSVVYENEKFVAVGYGAGNVETALGVYSLDGITWTQMSLSQSRKWTKVVYGQGKFVAVAEEADKAAYSYDGITWYDSTPWAGNKTVRYAAYGNGKFVAVNSSTQSILVSTNGIDWSETTLSTENVLLKNVVYGNNMFIIFDVNSSKAKLSMNGLDWADVVLPETAVNFSHLIYADSKFVGTTNSVGGDRVVSIKFNSFNDYCIGVEGDVTDIQLNSISTPMPNKLIKVAHDCTIGIDSTDAEIIVHKYGRETIFRPEKLVPEGWISISPFEYFCGWHSPTGYHNSVITEALFERYLNGEFQDVQSVVLLQPDLVDLKLWVLGIDLRIDNIPIGLVYRPRRITCVSMDDDVKSYTHFEGDFSKPFPNA